MSFEDNLLENASRKSGYFANSDIIVVRLDEAKAIALKHEQKVREVINKTIIGLWIVKLEQQVIANGGDPKWISEFREVYQMQIDVELRI